MEITTIQGAISSISSITKIAKSLIELKSISEVKAKSVELLSVALEAQERALAARKDQATMIDEIDRLKKELKCRETSASEKQRYVLQDLAPGSPACVMKKSESRGEPPQWYCANCFSNSKTSILNFHRSASGPSFYVCNRCPSKILVPGGEPIPPYYADE
jgi:hypothetical protein